MKSSWTKYRDPVIADRTVDLMAIAYWFCFSGWGVASTIAGIPTITNATTPLYELVWGGTVGLLSFIACAAAASTFVNSRTTMARIRKKQTEIWAVSMLAGCIAVYPILIGVAALGGDADRIATFFVSVSFLIFPTWRVRHLYYRIRELRKHIKVAVS